MIKKYTLLLVLFIFSLIIIGCGKVTKAADGGGEDKPGPYTPVAAYGLPAVANQQGFISGNTFVLTWDSVSSDAVVGYSVYYSLQSDGTATLLDTINTLNATTYVVSQNITWDQPYYFSVRTRAASGDYSRGDYAYGSLYHQTALKLVTPGKKERKITYMNNDFGGASIWIMNTDGSNAKKLADSGYDPIFSPDGTKILYTVWYSSPSTLRVMDVDGNNNHAITTGVGNSGWQSSWSSTGTQILCVSGFSGAAQDACLMTAAGGAMTEISRNATTGCWYPLLIPDDTYISFIGFDGNVYRYDTLNNTKNILATIPFPADVSYTGLSISPDNAKLLFCSASSYGDSIYYVDVAGGALQSVPVGGNFNRFPAWLTDNKIIFQSYRSGFTYFIYSANTDGSQVTRLTNQRSWKRMHVSPVEI